MASQYSASPASGYPSAGGAYGGYSSPAASSRPVDPIISRLRPRDVVGIIDQAFRIYRRHFLTFLAIIAVVHIPVQGLTQLATVLLAGNTYSRLYNTSYYNYQYAPSTAND